MNTLYNGIELPDVWPPQEGMGLGSDEPMTVPYLENPPSLINVTIGRQLFVDDFLIESTDLKREYHKAVKYEGNPVLFPETPWEKDEAMPVACPKSGGVWWDPKDKIFKMWYEAGWLHQMAYAISDDGIRWERPDLDIEPGTNKILTYDFSQEQRNNNINFLRPDSTTVFIDHDCEDQRQRYKMFLRNPGGGLTSGGIAMTSADGIHWENFKVTGGLGDRSTIFYNPFRKRWVYSARTVWQGRTRNYREHTDFLEGATWTQEEDIKWLKTDSLDKPNPYIGFKPALYNVDAVAYESIMLGMFQIMYGPHNKDCENEKMPKITELIPMYSRDGFHFSRPCRDSLIQASLVAGSWDRGYVQSVGGVCLIMGEELWIYYIGFGGNEMNYSDEHRTKSQFKNPMYANGATGIAKLRRDGFASMYTDTSGELVTRLIKFADKTQMFVNFKGLLKVEILSDEGVVLARSLPLTSDTTKLKVIWNDTDELSWLNDKPIRIKFTLHNGALYSFWFSEDESGKSGGYLAAGAPKG